MRCSPSTWLVLGLCLVTPLGARALQDGDDADGRVSSQLTLNSRPVTVAFEPDLRADAPRASGAAV